jgi:hypothetical protein
LCETAARIPEEEIDAVVGVKGSFEITVADLRLRQ